MLKRTLTAAFVAVGLALATPAFAQTAAPKPVAATAEEEADAIFRQCRDENTVTQPQPSDAFDTCLKKGFTQKLDEEKNRANEILEKNKELVRAAVAHALEDAADEALRDCNNKVLTDLQRCLLGVALMHNGTGAAKKAGEDLQAIFQALELLGEGRGLQKPPKAEMATPSLPTSRPEKAADKEVTLPPAAPAGTKSGMPAGDNLDNQCVSEPPTRGWSPPVRHNKPKPTVRKSSFTKNWDKCTRYRQQCCDKK